MRTQTKTQTAPKYAPPRSLYLPEAYKDSYAEYVKFLGVAAPEALHQSVEAFLTSSERDAMLDEDGVLVKTKKRDPFIEVDKVRIDGKTIALTQKVISEYTAATGRNASMAQVWRQSLISAIQE